ncbi:MAG: NAD(P)-binding protein [Jatrophihabitans sp.]|uniref:NAD(P)-binding protein n=1 Tax=Jatrophihabitans sp. TaxID=1932789 RepID=UPI003F7FA5BE
MARPFAVTLDVLSSLNNHTGAWRTERPVYVSGLPPCTHACPAGEQVREWLYTAEDGGYEAAWRSLVAVNPLPAVMGRVCYHPCETACNRAQLDSSVGINAVERFLGDRALDEGWRLPAPGAETGRRVAVVGAGPAGLSAAYHLRRLGHHVTLFDAAPVAGGMMRAAIPTFRLPRDVLDAEVSRLVGQGIEFVGGHTVGDATALTSFDARVLTVGAQLAHRAYVPASQAVRVVDALDLLRDVAAGDRPSLGRRVVVYGGGNTAMDAARTVRRLGADDAVLVYRRTQAQMPAAPEEFADAVAEGMTTRWLRTITGAEAGELTIERMRLDDDGRPVPTGEYEQLTADTVVLALGQDVDRALLDTVTGLQVEDGLVTVDAGFATTVPGVFAAGDATGTHRSVTTALGQGRVLAESVDRWLTGVAAPVEAAPAPTPVPFERLNTWYSTDAPAALRPTLEAARRVHDFAEVTGGLDETTALAEARRCLSCGNCFDCDNCYGVCPDNAISKTDTGYVIDLEYCKGCGLCVAECPAGAIDLVPEPT